MVGSLAAAEAGTGSNAAGRSRHLPRRLTAGLALALLGACSAAPTPAFFSPAPGALPQAATARLLDMGKLKGLSAAEVVALFGEPDFRRDEPPAELWQYRGADCVLDLFLYDQAGGARVVYSEARDRSLLQAGVGQCAGGGDAVTRGSRQTRL